MNIKHLAFAVLTISFLLVGCDDRATKETNPKDVHHEQTVEDGVKLDYESYKKLFEHMDANLKIEGFQLKESTLGPDATAIDKDLSFDKREWLTVDGVMSNTDPKSSQEILYFEDHEQSTLLAINFSYTDSYIGEDMIQYQIASGFNEINKENSNKTDLIIISYKNLIVSVQQTKNTKVDIETTKLAVRKVIDELNKF